MYPLTITSTLLLALSAGAFAKLNTSTGTANMTITWYEFDNCDQNGPTKQTQPIAGFTDGLDYGVNTVPTAINGANSTMLSYKLSRPTTPDEQLDFSGPTKGMGDLNGVQAACTLFHETTSPDSNGNVLKDNQCYGLLLGPASVSCCLP